MKRPDGKYSLADKIDSETLEVLDKLRKTMELSSHIIYRTIKSEVYTDKHDYILMLPFIDNVSTVHIYNDYDCRSIQYIEQYVEGS